jgi:hypothetical protein
VFSGLEYFDDWSATERRNNRLLGVPNQPDWTEQSRVRECSLKINTCGDYNGVASFELLGLRRLLSRQHEQKKAANTAHQIARIVFTAQFGAAPTLRNRNGKKFQVVMWT